MTKRALLLHLLREAGDRGVTTNEIMRAGVGSRYGARLLELRDQGFVVEATRIRDGQWRYELVREPENVSAPSRPATATTGAGTDAAAPSQAASDAGDGEGTPAQLFPPSFDEAVPPLRPRFMDPDGGFSA